MARESFISLFSLIIGFILGMELPVFAFISPIQGPLIESSALQRDTSGFKIATTTQITSGNFIVSVGNFGVGTTPGYKLDIAGALRLQPSSAPTGANGVIYYDSSLNKFQCYQNGAWTDCIPTSIPSGAYIAFPDTTTRTGFTYTGAWESINNSIGSWTTKAPMPTAREYLAAAVVNNIIYAIGGDAWPSANYLSTNEAYNPSTNTWTTKASMPTARTGLAAAAVNNIIYAIGGCGTTCPLSTNEAYNPSTNTWTTKTPMPTAAGDSAAVVNNIIYVMSDTTNQAYDPSTDTWTTKTPMPTAAGGSAAVVNNIIYVMSDTTNQAYDPSTDTWTTKTPMPTPRWGFATAAVNNIIYAIGGSNGGSLSANQAYNPSTDTWTIKPPMPTPRQYLTAVAVNNIIYAIGGWTNMGSYELSTNEAYSLPYSPSLIPYWFQKQ